MTTEERLKIKLDSVNENIKLYNENKELLALYDQYLNNIVEFFDFIKKDESDFFYAILFDILLYAGMFSADKKFIYPNDEFISLKIKPGLSIINGEGQCRNTACFYEDIFSYFYNYPLKICCLDKDFEQNEDTLKYGNHVINLVYHHDTLYGFDFTNQTAFKPIDKELLKEIGSNKAISFVPGGNVLLRLHSITNMNDNLFYQIDEIRKILEDATKQKSMTKEEFNDLVLKANKLVIDKQEIIQSFITDNNELTHEIKKKILLLK